MARGEAAETGAMGRVYKDGEVLVRQGEAGDCMYVVQEGLLEVFVEENGQEVGLRVCGRGEIIGEMAIFESEVRSATVRAVGDARVLTVDRRTFLRRVQEDPSLAFNILRTMSKRIRELSEKLAQHEG
jgi:CRP-like cAMP-binding protein